jgi:hypothetical protein
MLKSGGKSDYERLSDIAVDLCAGMEGQRHVHRKTDRLARRLLRGVMPAVMSLAGALHRLGALDGEGLEELPPELLVRGPKFLLVRGPNADRLRAIGL